MEKILLQKAKQKLNEDELDSYFIWVQAVWLTARGEPLDFENHKYLVDIYQDQFPNLVFQKASQMGISERLVSEAVWVCDRLHKNSMYIFPTSSQLGDFVQARLEPVFNLSDYLSRITGV
ncbi:MAG: phage terminase large subunit family protein, partial [Candidatus Curtissbacteria bacterium]|nr:phage terminase large subunit family protein [Candidatus Curtissbacteria bacterium]